MGSKRTLDYSELIVDGDMSATLTSDSTDILNIDRVSYNLSFTTSDAVGTFSVEVSNDNSTWVTVALDTGVTAASADDEALIDVETAARYIRLKYARSSGSGTLQAHIVGKSISG
jgi:hypothetical protein